MTKSQKGGRLVKESIKALLLAEKETINTLGEKVSKVHKTKKELKKEAILSAALELFSEKGINATSIDDIVKKAGIAKGTFYLYFKDKYAVVDSLVLSLSSNIISRIMARLDDYLLTNREISLEEKVLFFVDSLIEVLLKAQEILPIVHKNISSGLFERAAEESYTISETIDRFTKDFVSLGGDEETAEIRIYMIIELANSTIYNAVVDKTPYTLSQIKPQLYEMIKRFVTP